MAEISFSILKWFASLIFLALLLCSTAAVSGCVFATLDLRCIPIILAGEESLGCWLRPPTFGVL